MRPPPLLQLFRGFLPLLPEFSPSRIFVQLNSFLSILSLHRSCILQRISTYTIPRLSSVLSSFFSSSSSVSFFFPIPIPPFLISSFLPCGILLPSLRLPYLLGLVFIRFPLNYSIDPSNSLIILYRVFSHFNFSIYEFLKNSFVKMFFKVRSSVFLMFNN